MKPTMVLPFMFDVAMETGVGVPGFQRNFGTTNIPKVP